MEPFTLDPTGQPTPCPFALTGDEVVNVDWSIGRYPDIRIQFSISNADRVEFFAEVEGLVRYDLPDGWIDDEFEFPFRGEAFVEDGTVQVETSYTHDDAV
jgi:hypothetical protein